MDNAWQDQEATNNEWDKRMRKVEAVIAGLPAWKEETVNLIRENKRADDTRYAEVRALFVQSRAQSRMQALQHIKPLELGPHSSGFSANHLIENAIMSFADARETAGPGERLRSCEGGNLQCC